MTDPTPDLDTLQALADACSASALDDNHAVLALAASTALLALIAEVRRLREETTDRVTPAAAITAFAAWLTGSPSPIVFGATADAAPIVQLLDRFARSQGFAPLHGDWTAAIKPYPEDWTTPARTDGPSDPADLAPIEG